MTSMLARPRVSPRIASLAAAASLLCGCALQPSEEATPSLYLIATADGTGAPLKLSGCNSDGLLHCSDVGELSACSGMVCTTLTGSESLFGDFSYAGELAASAPDTSIQWFRGPVTSGAVATTVVPARLDVIPLAEGASFSASSDITLRFTPTDDQDPIYVRTAVSCEGSFWATAEEDIEDPASGEAVIPAGDLEEAVEGSGCTATFTLARYRRLVTTRAEARAEQARDISVILLP